MSDVNMGMNLIQLVIVCCSLYLRILKKMQNIYMQ